MCTIIETVDDNNNKSNEISKSRTIFNNSPILFTTTTTAAAGGATSSSKYENQLKKTKSKNKQQKKKSSVFTFFKNIFKLNKSNSNKVNKKKEIMTKVNECTSIILKRTFSPTSDDVNNYINNYIENFTNNNKSSSSSSSSAPMDNYLLSSKKTNYSSPEDIFFYNIHQYVIDYFIMKRNNKNQPAPPPAAASSPNELFTTATTSTSLTQQSSPPAIAYTYNNVDDENKIKFFSCLESILSKQTLSNLTFTNNFLLPPPAAAAVEENKINNDNFNKINIINNKPPYETTTTTSGSGIKNSVSDSSSISDNYYKNENKNNNKNNDNKWSCHQTNYSASVEESSMTSGNNKRPTNRKMREKRRTKNKSKKRHPPHVKRVNKSTVATATAAAAAAAAVPQRPSLPTIKINSKRFTKMESAEEILHGDIDYDDPTSVTASDLKKMAKTILEVSNPQDLKVEEKKVISDLITNILGGGEESGNKSEEPFELQYSVMSPDLSPAVRENYVLVTTVLPDSSPDMAVNYQVGVENQMYQADVINQYEKARLAGDFTHELPQEQRLRGRASKEYAEPILEQRRRGRSSEEYVNVTSSPKKLTEIKSPPKQQQQPSSSEVVKSPPKQQHSSEVVKSPPKQQHSSEVVKSPLKQQPSETFQSSTEQLKSSQKKSSQELIKSPPAAAPPPPIHSRSSIEISQRLRGRPSKEYVEPILEQRRRGKPSVTYSQDKPLLLNGKMKRKSSSSSKLKKINNNENPLQFIETKNSNSIIQDDDLLIEGRPSMSSEILLAEDEQLVKRSPHVFSPMFSSPKKSSEATSTSNRDQQNIYEKQLSALQKLKSIEEELTTTQAKMSSELEIEMESEPLLKGRGGGIQVRQSDGMDDRQQLDDDLLQGRLSASKLPKPYGRNNDQNESLQYTNRSSLSREQIGLSQPKVSLQSKQGEGGKKQGVNLCLHLTAVIPSLYESHLHLNHAEISKGVNNYDTLKKSKIQIK